MGFHVSLGECRCGLGAAQSPWSVLGMLQVPRRTANCSSCGSFNAKNTVSCSIWSFEKPAKLEIQIFAAS